MVLFVIIALDRPFVGEMGLPRIRTNSFTITT